jgi:signal transduction histidine kinase
MTTTAVPAPPGHARPLAPAAPSRIGRGAAPRRVAPQRAAAQERQRLARELHDGVIQDVLGAGLAIDWRLAELPAGSPLRAKLEQARQLTGRATRRLRSSLRELREGGAGEEDLPDMLRRLETSQPGRRLEVSIQIAGQPAPIPAPGRGALHQVARECVFNALVHGRARRAVIRLSYASGIVALCVADDGRGNPETIRKILHGGVPGTGGGYHTGLADIAAHAAEMGWTLRVWRSDLGGIAIEVLAPLFSAGKGEGAGRAWGDDEKEHAGG